MLRISLAFVLALTSSTSTSTNPCEDEQSAVSDATEALTAADEAYVFAVADAELADTDYEFCEFNTPGQCGAEEAIALAAAAAVIASEEAADAAAENLQSAQEDLAECCGSGGGSGDPEDPLEEPEEPTVFAPPAI